MAKLVKKKKKLGIGRVSAGPAAREISNLRPRLSPKLPSCINSCPNNVKIREALMTVSQAEAYGRSYEEAFRKAWEIITERNPLPAVCGRVCPHPCESGCNRNQLDGAVGINNLERFVGDYAIEHGFSFTKKNEESYPEKIAVIGSGPSGLSCAYQLALLGYRVTIYESFSKPGGMLRYGIPSYRLPRSILDAEIDRILKLGVDLKCNTAVGKDISYEDLRKEYSCIFVGIGAHKGLSLGINGENAPNVYTGAEFLNMINSGQTIDVGGKVVVIGGGDSAIDAARVCKRLGADTMILYRRTINEMPAIKEEVEEAQREGVKLEFLAAPVEVLLDRRNGDRAVGMKCIRMQLKKADSSGRPRPVPIQGSEFTVDATTIIAAISQEPDFSGLEFFREGRDWIKVNDHGETKIPGTFAGGDVLELGLVTIAIFHGRRAAAVIHWKLRGIPLEIPEPLPVITHDNMKLDFYEKKDRVETPKLPVEQRFAAFDCEVTRTLSTEQAIEEAKRCMSCGSCFDCGTCWSFCQDSAIVKPSIKGEPYQFKMEFCTGCKKCAEECPCGYIEMV